MFTKKLTGLSASQVEEILADFSENAHHWDKARGIVSVDFDSEEEAEAWWQNFEFAND